jgi:hypothetical protein
MQQIVSCSFVVEWLVLRVRVGSRIAQALRRVLDVLERR